MQGWRKLHALFPEELGDLRGEARRKVVLQLLTSLDGQEREEYEYQLENNTAGSLQYLKKQVRQDHG